MIHSLKDTPGVLVYTPNDIETFYEQLALAIDDEVENVKEVIEYLEKFNLVMRLSENEYLLCGIPEMVKKDTNWAVAKRRQRARQNKDDVCGMSEEFIATEDNVNIIKDIERDIDNKHNNNKSGTRSENESGFLRLIELKVSPGTAFELAKEHSLEEIERVYQGIDNKDSIKNMPGMIVSLLKQNKNINIPEKKICPECNGDCYVDDLDLENNAVPCRKCGGRGTIIE